MFSEAHFRFQSISPTSMVAVEENCGGFYEVSVLLNAQLVCSGDFGGLLLGRCLLVHMYWCPLIGMHIFVYSLWCS